MRYQLCYDESIDEITLFVIDKMPKRLRTSIYEFLSEMHFPQISEIRLHENSCVTFIANSKNIKSDIFISNSELGELLQALCSGSVYAHFDTIKEGYISIGRGIRAGVCGRALVEGGKITGISEISSVNIRLPKRIPHSADFLFNLLKENGFKASVLLYSAPAVGKTTILRELIYLISSNQIPIRHTVIDSREEITPFMEKHLISSDVFISYPKGLAIEIATKSMSPELIICDEISSFQEASAILNASNCGVNLIASTHASSFEELCSKEILKGLFSHGVFDYALGIKREVGSKKYEFSLDSLKESYD